MNHESVRKTLSACLVMLLPTVEGLHPADAGRFLSEIARALRNVGRGGGIADSFDAAAEAISAALAACMSGNLRGEDVPDYVLDRLGIPADTNRKHTTNLN